MSRQDDVFHTLKVIRRIVEETHALAVRAIEDGARTRDEGYLDQLIDERARLATALEGIRLAIAAAAIEPRTRNLGEGARGTGTSPTTEH